MRVFMTGASGFIGSATIRELIDAGHEVTGLVRSDEAAAAVTSAGAVPLRGSLDDLDVIRAAVEASDAVIHLGFKHGADAATSARAERGVVTTIGDALAGSDRPFLFASGVALVSPGRVATEDDAVPTSGPDAPRGGGEKLSLDYADQGVRTVALRFAPTVHGEHDHGFTATIAKASREKGAAAYVGDGANRWSAVNVGDAARLIRLALEKAPARSAMHAIGEEGIPTREIAEAIGRNLDIPVESITPEEAADRFGWVGTFFALDVPASSESTRQLLGWTPTHQGLIADIDAGYYPGR